MKSNNWILGAMLSMIMLLFVTSCKNDKSNLTPQEDIIVQVPQFNSQEAYHLIEKQLGFGYRVPGTENHLQCGEWMIKELKESGFEVEKQLFDATFPEGNVVAAFNIVARYKPHVKERLLLSAHWDSRYIAEKDTSNQDEPIMGADDGGSGVAVLLSIARLIKANPIPMGIDIVLFDMEDQGVTNSSDSYSWCKGSQYWSKNLPTDPYEVKYGILLDMVGAEGAKFPKERYSMQYAGPIVNKIWDMAAKMNKQQYFINKRVDGIVDDHYFVNQYAGIPMLNIVSLPNSYGFGSYHHTHKDNIGIISEATLQAVGQVVVAVIYNESNKRF